MKAPMQPAMQGRFRHWEYRLIFVVIMLSILYICYIAVAVADFAAVFFMFFHA